MFTETTAARKIKAMTKRIRALPGGTSAGKTIGVLLFLIAMAQTDKKPTLTSIVSESFPHLRKGAMRDFLNIMQEHKYFKDGQWCKGDYIYTFETGSKIEFFSADQSSKLRGGRRDRLFQNECNNNPFAAFEELEVRTKEFIILDWNPVAEFWYYSEVKGKRDDVEELTLTYLDTASLDPQIFAAIEARRGRKDWWKVYGLGQLGKLEGQIYTDWRVIDDVPHEARLAVRGLDFGYSVDPTVIEDIHQYNGGYITDEQCFSKGLHNRQIAELILNLPQPQTLVIADSAEPKSIDEIKSYGVNIIGAVKGQGSVKQGIDFVQSQKISITKRSLNTIKSLRNYLWKIDKDGKPLNVPEHAWSDCADALRYGMTHFIPNDTVGSIEYAKARQLHKITEKLTFNYPE